MFHVDEGTLRFLQEVRESLAWLESEHPERVALIALARHRIRTFEMAVGTDRAGGWGDPR